MINVDISNIWGMASLPDLLALEASVSAAHKSLREAPGYCICPVPSGEELRRIREAAELIRSDSEILVVTGAEAALSAPRGAIELLQGARRNLTQEPDGLRIFFVGCCLSTAQWQELTHLLAGKDFSLCAIPGPGGSPARSVAFRELEWLLERRYGTDEARRRIYVIAREEDTLARMASDEDWQLFALPEYAADSPLSPAGLLPMAAAGIDIEAVLRGTLRAEEELDLLSFENPAWLYAAGRHLLCSKGCRAELLTCSEPGFRAMGDWWQNLFSGCGGDSLFPIYRNLGTDCMTAGNRAMFATLLHFAPGPQEYRIRGSIHDPAGMTLDQAQTLLLQETQDAFTDENLSVLSMECPALSPETLGAVLYFFCLSCALYKQIGHANPAVTAE